MKIDVLKNFGLDGQDLEAGTTVTVNKSHFGDNEQAFRDAGLFVDHAEEGADAPREARPPRKAPARRRAAEPAPEPERPDETVPEQPEEPETPHADDPAE